MKFPTQEQIAEALGVNQSTVSKYLNGRLDISVGQAIKLKDRFGIPLEAWRDIKSFIAKSSQKQASLRCASLPKATK